MTTDKVWVHTDTVDMYTGHSVKVISASALLFDGIDL